MTDNIYGIQKVPTTEARSGADIAMGAGSGAAMGAQAGAAAQSTFTAQTDVLVLQVPSGSPFWRQRPSGSRFPGLVDYPTRIRCQSNILRACRRFRRVRSFIVNGMQDFVDDVVDETFLFISIRPTIPPDLRIRSASVNG